MLGNRFALLMTFVLFAAAVYGLAWAVGDEVVGYIVAAVIFSGLGILEQFGVITVFRGFLRFALLIVLPSAAFPLADLGYLPFPDVALWIAAFTMLSALPIFWWQTAKSGQREKSSNVR